MLTKTLRIGTRKSKLALWQAQRAQSLLAKQGYQSIIVPIDSAGDQDLVQPLYEMGVQGIFTKALDTALLNHHIDLAVHSLKDVPTQLPEGILLGATLERGDPRDIIVLKNNQNQRPQEGSIATSSLRRQAQWLRRYPKYSCANLRGNVQTRLQKLEASNWEGALFALVGLERLDLLKNQPYQILDWMLPAPAQGAIGICLRHTDHEILDALAAINCSKTQACVTAERSLMRALQGGCSAPVGALATIDKQSINLKGGVYTIDGSTAVEAEISGSINSADTLGNTLAKTILSQGGEAILKTIKN